MTARHARRRGISTAEVIVGSALALLALSALYSFHLGQTRAFATQNAYNESQAITRSVMDLMTRELRMASYDTGAALTTSPGPTCPGVKRGITEARRDVIHFQQDLSGDGTLASPGEDVVYDVLADELRRADGGALPVVLVSGLSAGGFVLRYFDGSNPPVELVPATGNPPALTPSQRDCVTKIRIAITASVPAPNPHGPPLASMAESEVAIRNRSLANF